MQSQYYPVGLEVFYTRVDDPTKHRAEIVSTTGRGAVVRGKEGNTYLPWEWVESMTPAQLG